MATRSKLNWKVLNTLLPVLEKEGWSHAQIAEDWGISLATLEGHIDREGESMGKPERDIDWQRFDELKSQGLSMVRISKAMNIPRTTLGPRAQEREKEHQGTPREHQDTPEEHPSTPAEPELLTVHPGTLEPLEILPGLAPDERYTQEQLDTPHEPDHTEVHPGTLEGHQEVMEDIHESVPDAPHIGTEEPYHGTPEHPGTPEVHQELSLTHSGVLAEYSSVPARQDQLISTPEVHPGTPTADDWELWTTIKARWLEVEKMLADRQAILGTPLPTPGHTQKKTYVFDERHIVLIDQYAQDHRLDLKDVIYAAFQEFFERRGYIVEQS